MRNALELELELKAVEYAELVKTYIHEIDRLRAINTELMAALETVINWIDGKPHGLSPKDEKSIRAALAKAKGEG